MDFLTGIPIKIILPIFLLTLQVALKFFIDRRVTFFDFVMALLELPVSMLFLSLSLLAAFVIGGLTGAEKAFSAFVIVLVFYVICIFLWRRSVDRFEKEFMKSTLALGASNFILSLPSLIYTIYFLMPPKK